MTYINQNNIILELVNRIRSADIFTTSERGVTRETETFDGDSSTVTFTLSNLLVKNIKSVSVDGVSLSFGTDYTYDLKEFNPTAYATITFDTAPDTGTGNIEVIYDYGNTDKIFADYSVEVLRSAKNLPRVVVGITNFPSEPGGFGNVTQSNITFSISIYGQNQFDLREDCSLIRDTIMTLRGSLFYLADAIYPELQSPVIPAPEINPKSFQITQDFTSYFNYEIN